MPQDSTQPVLDRKRLDWREFALVGSDERATQRQGVSGNKQAICPDGLADLLQARPQRAVNHICRGFEGEHLDGAKHEIIDLADAMRALKNLHDQYAALGY